MTRRNLNMAVTRRVLSHVSARSGLPAAAIIGSSRSRVVVSQRQRVMRVLYRMGYSASSIGRALDRDHTTVLYAVRGRA